MSPVSFSASVNPRHMRRPVLLLAIMVAALGMPCAAEKKTPPAPIEQIELWPGKPPGEVGNIGPEKSWDVRPDGKPIPLVGGKPVKWLTNISKPTITLYRPLREKDTGASMLICPGGGLTYLAWDSEGEEVAAWLNSIGVTGIILKYRVPRRPDQLATKFMSIWHVRPLQDAQRALSVIRSRAKEWGLDPNRIGMVGFSAGAALTAWTSTNFNKRAYEPIDDIDRTSCRPDFAVLLYPGGGASAGPGHGTYRLDANVPIGKECPPMFFVAAGDDGDKPEIVACLYLALTRAGVPGELHIYASGGHDFALRPTDRPCSTWPARCADWLRAQGFLRR